MASISPHLPRYSRLLCLQVPSCPCFTPATPTTTLTKTKPELHVLVARESSSRLDVVGRNFAMMKGSESHVPATRMRSIREHASPFGATQLRNMATTMTDSSRCRHLQGQRGCCYTDPLMFLCLFLAVLTSFKWQSLSFSWGITHVLSLFLSLSLSLSRSRSRSLSLSLCRAILKSRSERARNCKLGHIVFSECLVAIAAAFFTFSTAVLGTLWMGMPMIQIG